MLLGVMAPAGSGKSKAGKHLRRAYGFKRLHAGAPVKQAMRAGFALSKDAVDGGGKEKPNMQLGGIAPRPVMEHVSEAVATHAPKATALALHPKIMKAMSAGRHVVVDGVRQQAEAALIHKMGGRLVAIDTGKSPDPAKPMDLLQAALVADHVVSAPSGKKKELKAAVDALMHKLMSAE
jgi:dephospho-CoA kinase